RLPRLAILSSLCWIPGFTIRFGQVRWKSGPSLKVTLSHIASCNLLGLQIDPGCFSTKVPWLRHPFTNNFSTGLVFGSHPSPPRLHPLSGSMPHLNRGHLKLPSAYSQVLDNRRCNHRTLIFLESSVTSPSTPPPRRALAG